MRGKALRQRREKNRELARVDAAKRCAICKTVLPGRVFLRWGDPAMFCSQECLDTANERDKRPF